jgi:hypothetical protein
MESVSIAAQVHVTRGEEIASLSEESHFEGLLSHELQEAPSIPSVRLAAFVNRSSALP